MTLGKVTVVRREELPIVEGEISRRRRKVLALVPGKGFKEIFKELGADAYLYNFLKKPSLKELEELVRESKEKVLLLPNDSDIVPLATVLQERLKGRVEVLPTNSVPEGIMALLSLDRSSHHSDLKEVLRDTKCGRIAVANRDGTNYREGEYVGIYRGRVVSSSKDLMDCLTSLLKEMDVQRASLIHIFLGEPLKDLVPQVVEKSVREIFGGIEVQVYRGGQPLYHLIVGVYP